MAERLLIFFLMLKKVTVMKNRNYDPLYLPYGYIFKEIHSFYFAFLQWNLYKRTNETEYT